MARPVLGGKAVGWAACLLLAAGTVRGQATAPKVKKPAARPAAKKPAADPTGADALTLRDGKTLLGQLYDPSPRGVYLAIVRREWAEANLPGWVGKWTAGEKDAAEAADRQRRERLALWRRDRMGKADAGDRVSAWLDRELARPSGPPGPSVLITARIARSDVKAVQRRGMGAARALRYGWLFGFKDVETMPLDDLKEAISARGVTTSGTSPIPLDSLLPPSPEPEDQWLLRRAATEVLNDEWLRFVRFGNVVLPEPVPGQPVDPATGAAVLQDTIRDVLGGSAADPLAARLAGVAARGRVGALVTRLDLAGDFESVTVESALFVRAANGGWSKGPWRAGTLRSGDVAPGAAAAIADDPQVRSAFGLIDSIAPGMVSPQMKRKSLDVGATTKRALSLARSALARDLSSLALPLGAAGEPAGKPKD